MSVCASQAWVSALLAGVLFLASPRKSSQKEGDPRVGALRVPCATRRSGRLAKLACGSDNASRLPPARLRCSAPLMGTPKASMLSRCASKNGSHGQPEKTAKNETHPSSSAPALLLPLTRGRPGGGLLSRPLSIAQHLPRRPQKRPGSTGVAKNTDSHGQRSGNGNFFNSFNPPSPPCQGGARSARHDLLLPLTRGRPGGGLLFNPLRGAEQRRNAGGLRRGLSEGRSPEFRSRPAFRVAQGTGAAGTDPGSPSFCLLFLGEARKSETPRKGGSPCQSSGTKP
jgi:hypothetical protein